MKKKRVICITVILLILAVTTAVFAAAQLPYKMTYKSGTSDTVTDLPGEETVTGGEAYTVSSQVPQRAGYEFIDWTLDYDLVTYRVTYVINPDPVWDTPEGSTVPKDDKKYAPGEMVDVHDQLTTTVTYALNENKEQIPGTWEFIRWDKDDFTIYEDTTVTGGWKFTPEEPKTYSYTVHYYLFDGETNRTKVHADKQVDIKVLPKEVHEDPVEIAKLNPKYRVRKNGEYLYYALTTGVTKTIERDHEEICIYYAEKGTIVTLTYTAEPDPFFGSPDDVTVPGKKTCCKGNTVTVAAALVSTQDHAVKDGVTVKGSWKFSGWSKTGTFEIDADTTVTGGWTFTPAAEAAPDSTPAGS